jgi:hypothetical protein
MMNDVIYVTCSYVHSQSTVDTRVLASGRKYHTDYALYTRLNIAHRETDLESPTYSKGPASFFSLGTLTRSHVERHGGEADARPVDTVLTRAPYLVATNGKT